MKLSDKNKKELENILGCRIDFHYIDSCRCECYNACFGNKKVGLFYNGSNNHYILWDPTLFDIIKSCNELLVLDIDWDCIDFMFIDDLVFINI